jgi:hypothetical protein
MDSQSPKGAAPETRAGVSPAAAATADLNFQAQAEADRGPPALGGTG